MNKKGDSGQSVKLYEFMIFNQNGVLIYFQDILNNKVVDIDKRLASDKDFRHRM